MNNPAGNAQRQGVQKPYEHLYIYYLEGVLGPIARPGPDYLGTWEEEGHSFVFFSRAADQSMADLLRSHPRASLIDQYEMSYAQWQGTQPAAMTLGSFQITPPWLVSGSHPDQGPAPHKLILDPGVVFGSGTHPTTRNCLEGLEAAFAEAVPGTVLDLGTGTGVLALAAARLGCPRVLAVDINYLAVQTTLTNIRLNNLGRQVLAVQGSAGNWHHGNVELLVANIHYDIMERIISTTDFAAPKRFILSGLMRSEAREVQRVLLQRGARIFRQWTQDDIWQTFYGKIG